jgi:hypothetical protein
MVSFSLNNSFDKGSSSGFISAILYLTRTSKCRLKSFEARVTSNFLAMRNLRAIAVLTGGNPDFNISVFRLSRKFCNAWEIKITVKLHAWKIFMPVMPCYLKIGHMEIHPSGKYVTLAIKLHFLCMWQLKVWSLKPNISTTKTRLYSQGDILSTCMYC